MHTQRGQNCLRPWPTHINKRTNKCVYVCVFPVHLLNVKDKTESVESLPSAVMDDLPERERPVCV